MLLDINDYLFLKLNLPYSKTLRTKEAAVYWNNRGETLFFDVGKSYLPKTLIASPYGELIIETQKKSFTLDESSFLLLGDNEKYIIKYKGDRNYDCLMLFFNQDSIPFNVNAFTNKVMKKEYKILNASKTFLLNFERVRNNRFYEDNLFFYLVNRLKEIQSEKDNEINKLIFKKKSTREDIYKKLSRSIEFIEVNYNKKFSIDDLAAEANISKFHFIRSFKQLFNITPYEYLTSIRISNAKYLLEKSEIPINEVSYSIGYENLSHFSLNFKKITGISPLKFRNNHKKSNYI